MCLDKYGDTIPSIAGTIYMIMLMRIYPSSKNGIIWIIDPKMT